MPATSSINGIISGLSTDEIVSKIMENARRPVDLLMKKQADLTQKLAAWQEFNTRLLALQTTASSLANAATFASNSVTSSDENILSGTAAATAAQGTYYIKVESKAQTQQLASQGFANVTDAVGTGTVRISILDGTAFDVKIDASNNSLQGLRDAINKAGKGVTAVIVNNGDAENPYQLLVTTNGSGTGHAMSIDTSGLTGGTQPLIDQVVQEATDATLTLGSGAGQIRVTKSTNTITDLIPGVTLNIKNADPTKTITLEIATDISAIQKNVGDFVTQYNNAIDFLNSQFRFDMELNSQGVLFGDFRLQKLQSDLGQIIVNPTAGLNQELKVLSHIGITMGQDGKLSVNNAELAAALRNNLPQVNALFSSSFDSSNPSVTFVASSPDTQATSWQGYEVKVTVPPLRAQITMAIEQAGNLTQTEQLTLNGRTILLEAGMSQAEVIAEINKYSNYTGVTALATGADGTGSGNYLTLRQMSYGPGGHITVKSDTSVTTGTNAGIGTTEINEVFLTGESGLLQGHAGQYMEGTINGVEAKSDGQYLIAQGSGNNQAAKGLRLKIDSSVPLTSVVHFTKGVGLLIKDFVSKVTDVQGSITTAEETLGTEIKDVKNEIAEWNERLAIREQKLYLDFQKMEDALGKLQSQGNTVAALLSSISLASTGKK